MTKQYNPFDALLDSHSTECLKLYAVVQTLFGYPKLYIDDYDEGTENKLYATSFAYICQDYLVNFEVIQYPHEDFGDVSERMNFQENEKEIFNIAANLKITYDAEKIEKQKNEEGSFDNPYDFNEYDELVYQIVQKYRQKITADIKSLFRTKELQLRLFGSIFSMDLEDDFEPTIDLMNSGDSILPQENKWLYPSDQFGKMEKGKQHNPIEKEYNRK